jgi:ABC-type antimicrobial peptide transport system permease subunit
MHSRLSARSSLRWSASIQKEVGRSFANRSAVQSAIGTYCVTSYSVMQFTPEIGIRMALEARREQVLAMSLGQGCRHACAGIAISLISALTTTRLMARFLYGIQPTDPTNFTAVSLLLVAVALLACYAPARKAMKVDPMTALRHE